MAGLIPHPIIAFPHIKWIGVTLEGITAFPIMTASCLGNRLWNVGFGAALLLTRQLNTRKHEFSYFLILRLVLRDMLFGLSPKWLPTPKQPFPITDLAMRTGK
ncbi:MAG: hypothetical protein CM15mP49_25600 [Actinomycetota bacterium]|nr:MAG: hypothetical protein CM15mP49_25600 [Actinomycetota bacterium]